MSQAKKVEQNLPKVTEWMTMGKGLEWIASELDVSDRTLRRVLKGHNLRTVKPKGIIPVAGAASKEWGNGRAEMVAPTGGDYEVVIALSDVHFPYQDDAVIESALRLIKSVKPDRVVLNGDICDFFQLSRFNTEYESLDTLQEEIDQGNRFRRAVRKAAPNAIIDETEGNHDSRIQTFVAQNAKAISTLRALQPTALFLHDELEFNWHPGCGFLLREDFLVKHGTEMSSINGSTARAELNKNWISGISGHVHRSEQARRNAHRSGIWGVSGCMCRLDPDYITGMPNWDQGIIMVEVSNLSGRHSITNIPMVDGKLRFGGRSY